jgi:hypothetical protein
MAGCSSGGTVLDVGGLISGSSSQFASLFAGGTEEQSRSEIVDVSTSSAAATVSPTGFRQSSSFRTKVYCDQINHSGGNLGVLEYLVGR